jgi:2-hydroxychromene-2-carboxylate isomerase
MTKTIDFLFDFGSPNAYLAWKVIGGVAARTGAHINIIPCLLGGLFKITGNQPPLIAFGGVQGKLAYTQLEMARFVKKHGLDVFRFNPHFPVNTLLVMRGLVAAQHRGEEALYIEAVMRAMWQDGQKMDDPQVVAAVLTQAGLDAEALLAATQDGAIKAELAESTQKCADRGAFGIPTFFVADAMFFGKETLVDVEEELGL